MAINFMDPTAALERSFGLTKSGMPYSVARKLARYGIGQDDSDVPYMNPEQERSMMAELGQMGAHAIGTVGALLDVPGAMIRNALVGKPVTEPLVSPLSAAGRATGRDVLAKFGIMGETPAELPWYSGERIGRAAAGLGAEVVLDPLTWMTFGAGAATKAGRAMQSLGKQALRETAKLKGMGWRELWTTTKINPIDELLKLSPNAKKYEAMLEDFAIKNNTTLDALRGERLGTTLGLHIPFTHATMPIPSPLDYLAKGMDKRMSTLGTSMLGRHFQAAWNPEMMGTTSETVQPYAQKIFNDTLDLTAESRSKVFPMLETAAKAGWLDPSHIRTVLRSSGAPDHSMDTARRIADELGADLVHYAETKHIPGAAQIDLTKYPHLSQADLPVIKQVMDQFQGVTKAEFDLERQFGVNMETINENLLGYTHRRVNPMPDPGFKYPGHKAIDAQAAHQMERAKFMEYVPTKLLNELSIDDAISGQAWKYTSLPADFYKTAALDLETRYGARYAAELAHLKAANKDVNWQSLARWASNLNPLYAEKGIYRYATDPFEVLTRRVEASAQVRAAARGVFDILNDHAGMMVRGKPGEKAASVREVLGQTPGLQWLTDAQGVKHRDSLQAWLGDFFSKTNRANIQGRQALHDQLESSLGPLVKNGVTDEEAIAKWGAALVIPQSVGKDINRLMSTFTLPESLGPLMDVYDKVLNRWKRWVTIPWPAFHTRNFWSGMVRNAVAGNFNPIDYANATNVLQRGKLLPGAGKRYFEGKVISDEAASEAIRQELFSQRIVTHHGGMQDLNEIVPIGGTPLDIPGITKGWQPVRRIDPTKWNKATDPWLTGGAAGSYWVEGENRIAAYLNMRAKGMSPTAAADRVRQLQVDYSPQFTTQADRVMARLIPFWKFHKGILPWTVKTLLERPGGTLSQLAKRTATLRADTPLLPESVQRTTAIGLPPDEPGGMKFLSTLGFMEEPMYGAMAPLVQLPFSFAQGLGAPIRAGATPMQAMGEFAREIISQTNPLAKLVPELAFQRSSYFGGGESGGRELRTLTPPMGQLASRISTAFGRDMPVTPFGMPFATESIGRPAELLAGLTPVARLTSLLNTAFDPRKSWLDRATNIFTGLKTTDVSANQVAAQRNEALRNAMIAYGAKTFVKPYFKTEDLARMKGPERAQADALNNMARWLDYKYRQEKKAMGRS